MLNPGLLLKVDTKANLQQSCVARRDWLLRLIYQRAQHMFLLQKVDTDSASVEHENLRRAEVIMPRNKYSQLATQLFCATSCTIED